MIHERWADGRNHPAARSSFEIPKPAGTLDGLMWLRDGDDHSPRSGRPTSPEIGDVLTNILKVHSRSQNTVSHI